MSETDPFAQADEDKETAHVLFAPEDGGEPVEVEVPADQIDAIAEQANKGASY